MVRKTKRYQIYQGILKILLLISLTACSKPTLSSSITPQSTSTLLPSITPRSTSIPPPAITPQPTSTLTPTATLQPTQVPEHRIGVRLVNGLGEFYDRENGLKFVPRGMNYARLDHIVGGGPWHSTFDPNLYDPAKIDQAFSQMESDGYNVVRVFIDCCSPPGQQVGDPAGGLSSAYLEKVIDFLERAKNHHIFALLSVDLTPGEGGYNDPLWKAINPNFDGENVRYLTRGGLEAKRAYVTDFVQALIDLQAPLEAVFAYDLTNEVHFDSSMPPLSLDSGKVTAGNGTTYDMAKQDEKDRMVNENLVYWINQLRAAILELDSTALVETSFFVPQKPVPARIGDTRFILTEAAITLSEADFIDLHPYPGWGLNLSQYAENFGITATTQKPVIMGEFGLSTSSSPFVMTAAQVLRDWQIESCHFGFDGWLLWTWDTEEKHGFWNAKSGGGAIEKILSPLNRPDPCQAGSSMLIWDNLALAIY